MDNQQKSFKQFEDLLVWQKARTATSMLIKSLQKNKDFWYKDQIFRASASISNNIAEGFERKNSKEFSYFLNVAKGSCGEVRSMLYLGLDQNYLEETKMQELKEIFLEISKMLQGFINYLDTSK